MLLPIIPPISVVTALSAPTFQAQTGNGTDGTSFTFASHAIGTAASDRWVLAMVIGEAVSSRTVSSLTIGGVSASELWESSLQATIPIAVYALLVTTGTTADIVATFSGSCVRASVAVWSINAPSISLVGSAETATDAASITPGNADTDVIIAVSRNVSGTAATWTNVTDHGDVNVESTAYVSAGSVDCGSADIAVTCDWSGSPTTIHTAAVSLRSA